MNLKKEIFASSKTKNTFWKSQRTLIFALYAARTFLMTQSIAKFAINAWKSSITIAIGLTTASGSKTIFGFSAFCGSFF